MTDQADAYEVQFLIPEGDRGGQWEGIGGNAVPLEVAQARRAELRRTDGESPYRVVPFGTGPNPRPGDVTAGGAIIAEPGAPGAITDRYGVTFTQCGPIMVTPEQAENAAQFGWSPTGQEADGAVEVSL